MTDNVNQPSHYTQSLNDHGIECIQAIEASMTPEQFIGALKYQVEKYVWRFEYKGKPVEDLDKALYYLNALRKRVEKRENAKGVQPPITLQPAETVIPPATTPSDPVPKQATVDEWLEMQRAAHNDKTPSKSAKPGFGRVRVEY